MKSFCKFPFSNLTEAAGQNLFRHSHRPMDSGPLLILSVILNPDAAPAAVSYPSAAKLSPDSVLVLRPRVVF